MDQDPRFAPFDIAPAGAVPPLDAPAMPGITPQAPPAQQGPQGRGGRGMGELARFLPILALAAKTGGRAGIAGVLQGMQQARARKANDARLAAGDARQARLDQQTEDQRQQQLMLQAENQRLAAQQRQQQVRQQFATALQNIDDPAAIPELARLFAADGSVPQADLERFAMTTVTPSALQQRAAERIIADLEKQHGDKWIQIGPSFTYRVRGEDQPIPFEEVLRRAGRTQTAPLPQSATPSSVTVGSFEDYLNRFATERQTTVAALTTAQIEEARKRFQQADDRVSQSGGMTDVRRIATFNQIAGAYDRSPLVRAADRTIVLADAIKAIEANPSDPSAQLALAYSYIQALDTYQSAVREGELQNLGVLGTRLQSFVTALNRVAESGAFLNSDVAKNIAQNAKQLVATIDSGRRRKMQEFASRAKVSGVGAEWDEFVAGLPQDTPTPAPAPPQQTRPGVVPPAAQGAGPVQGITPDQNPFRRGN